MPVRDKAGVPLVVLSFSFFLLLAGLVAKLGAARQKTQVQEKSSAATETTVIKQIGFSAQQHELLEALKLQVEFGRLDEAVVADLVVDDPIEVLVTFDESDIEREVKKLRDQLRVDFDIPVILEHKRYLFEKKKSNVLTRSLDQGEFEVLEDYRHFATNFVRLRTGSALLRLLQNPAVAYIGANRQGQLLVNESLPLINATRAHAVGALGAGTAVAVLDTGVNYKLPEFGGCTEAGPSCKVVWAKEFAPDDKNPLDDDKRQHGTNVAAIALRVAPATKVLALDVFVKQADGENVFFENYVLRAIDEVIATKEQYKTVAVNLSLGYAKKKNATQCGASNFSSSVTNATNAGIAIIAASGNDGFTDGLAEPACVPGVISVGAVYDSILAGLRSKECFAARFFSDCLPDIFAEADKVACFSNSAEFLTVLAPGIEITAGGVSLCGTSQAAPHVSGAVAVLKSANPRLTVDQVREILTQTGVRKRDSRNDLWKPRLDLYAAVLWATLQCRLTPLSVGQAASGVLQTTDCPSSRGANGYYADSYSFSASAGEQIAAGVVSSEFDTYLYLYGPDGRLLASDDDGGGGTNSRIPAIRGFFTAPKSGTYTIQVTSYDPFATGSYRVAIASSTKPLFSNDSCATAQTITTTSFSTRVDSFLKIATSNDPIPQCGNRSAENSVWFKFTAPSSGLVTVDTFGSNFDTILSVYTGSCGTLRAVSCDDDSSGLQSKVSLFNAVAGNTYYVMVSSYEPGGGTVSFNLRLTPCSVTAASVGQTILGELNTTSCQSISGRGYYAERYSINGLAGENLVVQAISSDFDAYLYLLDADGRIIHTNDDGIGNTLHARIPEGRGGFTLPHAGKYVIELTSSSFGEIGNYALTIRKPSNGMANLRVTFDQNPVPKSQSDSDGNTWLYKTSVSETNGVGIVITKIATDFYDQDGRYRSTQTENAAVFAKWFGDCEGLGLGRPYIRPISTVCGSFRIKLTNPSGSIIDNYYGIDDNGNEIAVKSPRLILSP